MALLTFTVVGKLENWQISPKIVEFLENNSSFKLNRTRKDSKFQQIGERKIKLSNFKAKSLKEGDF
jgi:hypothetical protein